MNNAEFDQLVSKTRLSKRSVDAARLVFVDGKRQVEVCQETGIGASQLSRVVAMLDKEDQQQKALNSQANSAENEISVSRAKAVKQARDLNGETILVRNAPEDGLSIGKVLLKTDYHLVQELGRDEVMVHELSKINRLPTVGSSVELVYKNGFAEARQRQVEKERGGR
ncbi:KfrB domain-containing protein [Methylovorus glucosotrophus]|uniref:TrfB transcriptional repressor protein domain-containing protein n=1 Tax=Methylovorus glucosotrophus (strain SIP3-4) TaxID=582744 RepID=C6XEQ8_METGS|nr:TrfB-related DNA-binding protein [Methylovorus glucosotrophus]ACT52115.1 hypothetical protein Msip34_2891 [Methylovorus glucosotrophus SIP3-4]